MRRVALDGTVDPEPVLDVRRRTRPGGELGLLGLAFHPDGTRAYLHFTTPRIDTRVVEVDLATRRERELLAVDQPCDFENHKGGQLAFGPDGALHLALGDGGSAFNPCNTAQDPATPFGKLLRCDGRRWRHVAHRPAQPVALLLRPRDRPAVDRRRRARTASRRSTRSTSTGTLLNFGWAAYEGPLPVGRKPLRDAGRLTWPVAGFDHDTGCSVTGGVVYRGRRIPRLRGRYVFGDFCRGTLWTMRAERPAPRAPTCAASARSSRR